MVNQQLATCLRVALEQQSLEIPVNSRTVADGMLPEDGEDGIAAAKARKLTQQERGIYLESDALQVEMGNVIMKVSAAGNYLYETAKSNQHKDRYSSVAMAVRYIAELEENRKRMLAYGAGANVVGVVTRM